VSPSDLEQHILTAIPLARAMDLRIDSYVNRELRLCAPLAPNRNDKGCAFGGSLTGLLTLAGWGSAVLALGSAGAGAEIYVQDSSVRYLAPVWEDIVAVAWLDAADAGAEFIQTYGTRGRARASIQAECRLADGTVAATLAARFVAIDPMRRRPA
jgi:thioesterase domain-containing protein